MADWVVFEEGEVLIESMNFLETKSVNSVSLFLKLLDCVMGKSRTAHNPLSLWPKSGGWGLWIRLKIKSH